MKEEVIVTSADAGVTVVTINRPKQLNALNEDALLMLESVLEELQADESRVIVLTGAGQKAFVAGADVEAMSTMSEEEAKGFSLMGQNVMSLVESHSKPIIAAINGYALGGGCELALACDLRYASSGARIGQPEINLGIMPGWGATQRLSRLVGLARAKEMLYSGEPVDAEAAERMGLINKVLPADGFLGAVVGIARGLAQKAPIALGLAKKAINLSWQSSFEQGLSVEERYFARCFNTKDQKEGIDAFRNRRKAKFEGK